MTTRTNLILDAARQLLHRGDDGGEPVSRNNVGFNRLDYPFVRNLLAEIESGDLSRQQALTLMKVLRRYQRQLGEVGISLAMLSQAAYELPAAIESAAATIREVDEWFDGEPGDPIGDGGANSDATCPNLPTMADILGPGGVIAQRLPGYESRPQQVQLAQAIAGAIREDQSILAEAGTGTGKSLAYLVPAIYAGKKTIVSTEGKALQDQLAKMDLPFLQAVLPVGFRFAVLKGLSNYLCRWAWDEEAPKQALMGESPEFAAIRQWLGQTESGDLAEAPVQPSPELRQAITVSSDECLGAQCPYAGCFAMRARRLAKDARIVVVNHTLLALDLALRDKTDDGASVLPDRELVIVDEAHSLEDVATKAFTAEISDSAVTFLLRGRVFAKAQIDNAVVERARERNDQFFALLRRQIGQNERTSAATITPTPELRLAAENVSGTLSVLADQAGVVAATRCADDKDCKALQLYGKRLRDLGDRFLALSAKPADTHVLFVERERTRQGRERLILKRSPVSVADDLQRALWERWPVVATSATLSTHGNFQYFGERTGCSDARKIVVDSPFDFRRNALIYLPPSGALFDPSRYYQAGSVEYFDRLGDQIEQLLLASDGRAFCLFTSRKALDEVYNRIAHRLRWNLYRQGDASPQRLIEQFKSDGRGVLFGLRSFWAGVDVQGGALSLVCLDKLPFPTPDEPVYQARCDQINRATGDQWAWFKRLALPLATIQFKQGFGRAIRSKTDRAVLALLDGRLTTKGYGVGILRSLPPALQTRSIDAVKQFFAR